MSPFNLYLALIIFLIYITTGTFITRYLARINEWNSSYKIAFIVIFIWMTITFTTSCIIALITGNFSFTEAQLIASVSFYMVTLILSLTTFLIIGPLIVKKLYETEFRESFSMALRILLYESIVQFLFFPLYLI